jgi:hypothetical protein
MSLRMALSLRARSRAASALALAFAVDLGRRGRGAVLLAIARLRTVSGTLLTASHTAVMRLDAGAATVRDVGARRTTSPARAGALGAYRALALSLVKARDEIAVFVQLLVVRVRRASARVRHGGNARCRAALASLRDVAARVGTGGASQVTRDTTTAVSLLTESVRKRGAQRVGVPSHVTHSAALASLSLERSLRVAVTGWRVVCRSVRNALVVVRAVTASLPSGAVHVSRGMARSRAVFARTPLLESAAATLVLMSVIIGLTSVGDAPPRGQARAALVPVKPLTLVAELAPALSPTSPVQPSSGWDHGSIQAVLNRYRDAMSTLDVSGVRSVWPTVSVEDLRSGFARLAEQNVEFSSCLIAPSDTRATASCTGVIESGFSTGRNRPRIARTRWEFSLERLSGSWTITAVDTQPR